MLRVWSKNPSRIKRRSCLVSNIDPTTKGTSVFFFEHCDGFRYVNWQTGARTDLNNFA